MSHGYSEFALPTFSFAGIRPPTKTMKNLSPSEFANHLQYLYKPSADTDKDTPLPSGKCTTDNAHNVELSNVSWPWTLSMTTEATVKNPNPDSDYIIFSEKEHLYPKVHVLNVPDASTVDAWKVTAFGMVIESFELDASVVPHPSINIPNGIENSWFADSCIPLKTACKATHFGRVNAFVPAMLKRTSNVRTTRFPAASHLINRTQVIVPRPAKKTSDTLLDAKLPGLTISAAVTTLWKSLRFLGFNTVDSRSHASTDDSIPGVHNGILFLWSPYTYVGYSDNDYDESTPMDYSVTRTYFLSNLRSIYGTRFPLIEIKHALDAMPIN